jgi:hypothetical protein
MRPRACRLVVGLGLILLPIAGARAEETSSMDDLEKRAKELEPRIAALGTQANRVDDLFADYLGLCYDRFSGKKWADRTKRKPEPKHEWLVTPVPEFAWQERWVMRLELSNDANPSVERCRTSWKNLAAEADVVVSGIETVEDDARRQGILPGHLRKLLEKHDLQD